MPAESSCPPKEILERFVLGQLSPLEVERWAAHVEQCGRCHASLRAFHDADTVVEALQHPGSAEALRRHQLVQSLMEKLSRWQPAPAPRRTPVPPLRSIDSVAGLVDTLCESYLLGPAQREELSALQGRFREPRGLARELLRRNWLTPYQVNQVFLGRSHDLVLGDYLLLERLGEGGFGQVFKARHQLMNRVVAVKVIRKDRLGNVEMVRRFQREIRAVAQLSHPNIITAYDAALVGDTYLLVMEYVEGVDLKKVVDKRGPLPVAEACGYIRQAALGLQHALESGLVHRDIKPANLLLAARGAVVKILDMGLARLHEVRDNDQTAGELTQEGSVMGTPDFMAPEQCLGSHGVDIRADLYSLGCTLFHLLTGKPPFAGGTLGQKIARHQLEPPPAVEKQRPDVPAALGAVLRKLMAKRPDERYQTPSAAAAALKPFCGAAARAVPVGVPLRQAAGGSAAAQAYPLAVPVGAGLAALGEAVARSGDETVAIASGESIAGAPSPPSPPAQPSGRLWGKVQQHRLALGVGSGLFLLGIVVWLAIKLGTGPYSPSESTTAPQERYPWQPKELIQVVGEHRLWHARGVNSVAVSKDGKLVASGGGDGMVLIGDAETLVVRHYLKGHTHRVRCVAFSPTGKILASASEDTTVRVWDVATEKELGRLDKHTASVTSVAFSPDGLRLLSGSADTTVRLWDVHARKQLKCFSKHTTPIHCVAYSPDGLYGFSGSGGTDKDKKPQDCGGRLWNLKTGKQIRRLETPGMILSAAFSPDGLRVITGGSNWDRFVRLWDVATGALIHPPFSGPQGDIPCVAFFPNGQRAISCAWDDQTLRIWELKTPGEVRPFGQRLQRAVSLAVYPDGRRVLVTAGNQVRLLDVSMAKEVRPLEAGIHSFLAFSPDSRQFLTTSEDGVTVDLRELKTGKVLRFFKGHTGEVTCAAWSADGRRFLTGSRDGTMRLWQANTGDKLKIFKTPQFDAHSVALSHDGKYALYGGDSKTGPNVELIDVATGKEVRGFGGQGSAYKVVFSPDSRHVFACISGGTFCRWDRNTAKRDWSFQPQPSPNITDIALSKDARHLYIGGKHGSVWRLDLAKPGSEPKELRQFFAGEVRPQAVSPDGQTLAVIVSRKTLALLDGRTGLILREWKAAFPGDPQIAAFIQDGKRLAVCNGNGTVYILDVAHLLAK